MCDTHMKLKIEGTISLSKTRRGGMYLHSTVSIVLTHQGELTFEVSSISGK